MIFDDELETVEKWEIKSFLGSLNIPNKIKKGEEHEAPCMGRYVLFSNSSQLFSPNFSRIFSSIPLTLSAYYTQFGFTQKRKSSSNNDIIIIAKQHVRDGHEASEQICNLI